jgi:splicing factor 3A subunit 3
LYLLQVTVQFSGEEVFGKYLDLNAFYDLYCNLPGVSSQDLDYIQYLNKFNSFFYIPENSKSSKHYVNYISGLWNYLSDYFWRIQPLIDLQEFVDKWQVEFESKWKSGLVQGWAAAKSMKSNGQHQELRLGMFNSSSELEALGLDRLKEGLEALGLKCGGTLQDRAQRLWSVRGKKPADIPEKLKKKTKVAKDSSAANGGAASSGEAKRQVWYNLLASNK